MLLKPPQIYFFTYYSFAVLSLSLILLFAAIISKPSCTLLAKRGLKNLVSSLIIVRLNLLSLNMLNYYAFLMMPSMYYTSYLCFICLIL